MDIFLNKFTFLHKRKKPSADLQLRFLKQLHKLLSNGYSLIDAFQMIQLNHDFKPIATEVIDSLITGQQLAQSLKKVQFHPMITSYLQTIQSKGDMKEHLFQCITMFKNRQTYVAKFKEIMRYPLFLSFIFMILLFIIQQYVLPSFLTLFQASSGTTNLIISIIKVINLSLKGIFCLSILLAISYIFTRSMIPKISVKQRIKLYTSIPILRSFVTLYVSFMFAIHVSTLLQAGMTMKEILEHLTSQANHPIIAYYASILMTEVRKGEHMNQLLINLPLIEKQFAIIFQKTNNISALEKDLTMYADMLNEQFHRKVMQTIMMIQPIFFSLLAFLIILMYLAIMWPMFDILKSL